MVIPIVVVTKFAIDDGVFRQMLGAYRRNGMVLTPNSRFMRSRVALVRIRLFLVGRVANVLVTMMNLTSLVQLQTSVVLQRKNVEENVFRTKHPRVVLRDSRWW